MPHHLRHVCKFARSILERLTGDLPAGESRKIDESGGTFMAVHVEHLHDGRSGSVFSVTHYYESNGDLVPDPDVTFLRDAHGHWFPLAYQDTYAYRIGVEHTDAGPVVVNARLHADQVTFVNHWMRNIAQQQSLILAGPETASGSTEGT